MPALFASVRAAAAKGGARVRPPGQRAGEAAQPVLRLDDDVRASTPCGADGLRAGARRSPGGTGAAGGRSARRARAARGGQSRSKQFAHAARRDARRDASAAGGGRRAASAPRAACRGPGGRALDRGPREGAQSGRHVGAARPRSDPARRSLPAPRDGRRDQRHARGRRAVRLPARAAGAGRARRGARVRRLPIAVRFPFAGGAGDSHRCSGA